MSYDFNDAKNIFEGGFKDGSFDEMFAFAKYSIHEVGNSLRATERLMEKKLSYNGFNSINLYETIHRACLWAKKPLSKETSVIITKAEIESIKNLPEKYFRILFVALFLAKKDGNSEYYNRGIDDSIRMAGVRFNEEELNEFLFFARDYLPVTLGRMSRKVLYSNKDSDIFAEIGKKENPMIYIPRYCKECGAEIEKNRHGMCDDCYGEFRKEILRKNSEDYRMKIKK